MTHLSRLVLLALLASPLPAAAQTALQQIPICAKSDQIGDLGFTGLECVGCVITGKHIAGRADIEFQTEPVLTGIARNGPSDGKLEERDVLVALDGQLITTSAAAVRYSWLEPGKPVRVTVRRGGILKEIDITPRPACRSSVAFFPFPNAKSRGWLGLGLSCQNCSALGVEWTRPMPFASFPEVAEVTSDSPAAKAGVKQGDVLIAINGVLLRTREGTALFQTVQPGQQVTLLVIRDASALTLTITATAR